MCWSQTELEAFVSGTVEWGKQSAKKKKKKRIWSVCVSVVCVCVCVCVCTWLCEHRENYRTHTRLGVQLLLMVESAEKRQGVSQDSQDRDKKLIKNLNNLYQHVWYWNWLLLWLKLSQNPVRVLNPWSFTHKVSGLTEVQVLCASVQKELRGRQSDRQGIDLLR